MRIVVLVKQVPDTRSVGKDAMKPDGTVNRAALPAIFNPDDLLALEQALRLREACGGTVTLLTMGLPKAAELLREGLYRGADEGVLLTDRPFGGSDTLATAHALAAAVRKLNPDVVIGGRQAIDGDTAQVGPQVAQKLGWPQITLIESIETKEDELHVVRRLSDGMERLAVKPPVLLTVTGSAPTCRRAEAKRLMRFKRAAAPIEGTGEPCDRIKQWGVADIDVKTEDLGLAGSPTKVKAIENVVFAAKEARVIPGEPKAVDELVKELLEAHIIG